MIGPLRATVAAGALLVLAACSGEQVWAPDAEVEAVAFRPDGPPTVTLMTMINGRSGGGGHSALMIDGNQRVIFDPAGSWHNPQIPERNDVLYGMHPAAMDLYVDFYTRDPYHLVLQEIEVTPEIANYLIQQVENHGAVPRAQCSLSVSRILSGTPGFEVMNANWFPERTMRQFGDIPGVQTQTIYDDAGDSSQDLLREQIRAERRAQAVENAFGND